MRKLLEKPVIYRTFQKLFSGNEANNFVSQYIKPFQDMKVLDIGCGPGLLLDSFNCDVHYTGFDTCQQYITYAQKRYPRQKFICDYISTETAPGFKNHYDIVVARGVLHHLNDAECQQLFKCAFHHLVENGRLITLDGVYLVQQHYIARWLLKMDRGKYVRYADEYKALAKFSFQNVKGILPPMETRLPYNHFIMECTK